MLLDVCSLDGVFVRGEGAELVGLVGPQAAGDCVVYQVGDELFVGKMADERFCVVYGFGLLCFEEVKAEFFR